MEAVLAVIIPIITFGLLFAWECRKVLFATHSKLA